LHLQLLLNLRKSRLFKDADRFRHPSPGEIMNRHLQDRHSQGGAAQGYGPATGESRPKAAHSHAAAYRYYRA